MASSGLPLLLLLLLLCAVASTITGEWVPVPLAQDHIQMQVMGMQAVNQYDLQVKIPLRFCQTMEAEFQVTDGYTQYSLILMAFQGSNLSPYIALLADYGGLAGDGTPILKTFTEFRPYTPKFAVHCRH